MTRPSAAPRRGTQVESYFVEERREPKNLNIDDARLLFKEISSVVVLKTGDNIVIDGTVGTPMAKARVDMVVKSFDNVVDLTTHKDNIEINAIVAQEIKERIGNEGIEVVVLRGSIILGGKAANESDAQKAVNIARTFAENVVNNIEIDEQMVELDLAFVSISRSKDRTIGGTPGESINASMEFADNLRQALRMNNRDVGVTLDTSWIWSFIAQNSENKVLNRPHLTTVTRKAATFHQGGERGYDVINQNSANVDFKEYGIMVGVMPELTSDGKIRCEVTFEVTLPEDKGNRLDFTTYKTSATALLTPGQSLVLSGLLRDIRERVRAGMPVLRNIPILNFFVARSRNAKTQDDLILIVTPSLPSCRTAQPEAYSLEQLRSLPLDAFKLRSDEFGKAGQGKSGYVKDSLTVY